MELTVRPAGGGGPRHPVVIPIDDERSLRYHPWGADRRAYVHEASSNRLGYLHLPDMVGSGWAQLHRDLCCRQPDFWSRTASTPCASPVT